MQNYWMEPTAQSCPAPAARSVAPVLPWESHSDFEALLAELREHHAPVGPTEEHLVEEIAAAIWRKRRLRQTEAALYRHEMGRLAKDSYRTEALVSAVSLGDAASLPRGSRLSLSEAFAPPSQEEAEAVSALPVLQRIQQDLADGVDYNEALQALPETWRTVWEEDYLGQLRDEERPHRGVFEPTAEALEEMLREYLLPHLQRLAVVSRYRPALLEQARGEAFTPEKMEVLERFEAGLDKRLERALAMLLRLQEIRRRGGLGS